MTLTLEKLQESLVSRPEVYKSEISYGELTVTIDKQKIVSFLTYLRDNRDFRFIQLVDLCGADYPNRPERFEVVYHLLSFHKNIRLRVKLSVADNEIVPSVTSIFPVANWFEREAFDMFGINFGGHDDLRRILTDYGFSGYPLRKDFPTTGYVELRYDQEVKRVVYEPVQLTQDFRQFDFLSPWEGMQQVLPGDEKVVKSSQGRG